jgi:ribonuclease Y
LENLAKDLSQESAQMIQASENKAKEEADDKAREILIDAMKHGATTYVPEYTVSIVKIADDEVKGRIIGKDGRNIRSFELATGVDVDLDDQPGQVRLSSFDPVRREIARITLETLIKDGRIQPTRIEETVQKVSSQLQKIMYEEGKKLCHAVGVYNLPSDLMQILGRFKYRFSYGQNLIAHTLEETKIGIALAQEVGANVEVVKLGCLLHDIGKVVTEEEGSHVEIGVNLLKKYRIPQVVIDCVEQHHEDVEFTSNESVLVYVADAISGARPGARYENYDEYVKRLTTLEGIAKSYDGVREAYAIQAGREVRVILNPDSSKDDDAIVLAHKIKERVQAEMTYPGTVTVTVIREVRGTDIAK